MRIVTAADLMQTTEPRALVLEIPLPPSVNAIYANRVGAGRGRIKTMAYRQWLEAAGWTLKSLRLTPVTGAYSVEIELPGDCRGDVDNRTKSVLDLLVSLGLTPDDRHCREVTARRVPALTTTIVTVREGA